MTSKAVIFQPTYTEACVYRALEELALRAHNAAMRGEGQGLASDGHVRVSTRGGRVVGRVV